MIACAVHLQQLRFKVGADLGENMSQLLDSLAVEDAATVFAHEDQMDVHGEHAMPAVSNIVDVHHRPE